MSAVIGVLLAYSSSVFAYSWQEGEKLPVTGLNNPYNLSESELAVARRAGLGHALKWPVNVTGALIPLRPTAIYLDQGAKALGLHSYPAAEGEGAYFVPFPDGRRPNYRMGVSLIEQQYGRERVLGYTFSCAACHSANLFGRRVMGLTNRFPRANHMFVWGKKASEKLSADGFQNLLGATPGEKAMYARTRENLFFVEARRPQTKGLDTSLAHTALSLSHRGLGGWAEKTDVFLDSPREVSLRNEVADSKPAVWWNVKYKNRWLLDGSVVSGNPIFTNLIWNEIGRGTDLIELNNWLEENRETVAELTAAVYASVPPVITDFVSADRIDLQAAKRGEVIFNNRCAKCHGTYEKNWSLPGSESWPKAKQLLTAKVKYFAETPVKNVGTDPQRYLGMRALTVLNDLEISKRNKIVVKPQEGYVPPPLEGIWARYPYFHNNSIPNLCELLKPADQRVNSYHAGEAEVFSRHYDFECGGYPVRERTPREWMDFSGRYFDTRLPGMSNRGHDKDFAEFTDQNRADLVKFLQTL